MADFNEVYNPSIDGQPFNKGVTINGKNPTDGKQYYYNRSRFLWRAYKDKAEVLIRIPVGQRLKGQTFYINSGGTLNTSNGKIDGGSDNWYVLTDDTSNATTANLIPLVGSGGLADGNKGDIVVSDGGNQFTALYTPPFIESSSRLLSDRLAEELWLEDFREDGDSDSDVIDKGIVAMTSLRKPLRVGDKNYSCTRPIHITGSYFNIIGTGNSRFQNSIAGYGRIQSAVPSILKLPSSTDPGPMRGCCFYVTDLIYYGAFTGIRIDSFRFGIAFLTTNNTPVVDRVQFENCNVGIICYTGMQNLHIINSGGEVNTGLIAMATGFPQYDEDGTTPNPFVSPQLTDEYCDQLTVGNIGQYNSWNVNKNVHVDKFVQESIFRPETISYTANISNGYVYPKYGTSLYGVTNKIVTPANGDLSYKNHPYWNCSGWFLYIPARNTRSIFSMKIGDLDFRSNLQRGIAFVNAEISELNLDGRVSNEGTTLEDTGSAFTFATFYSAFIDSPYRPLNSTDNFYYLTGNGRGALWTNISTSNKFWKSGELYLDQAFLGYDDGFNRSYLLGNISECNPPTLTFSTSTKAFSKKSLTQILAGDFTIYVGNNIKQSFNFTNVQWDYKQVGDESRFVIQNSPHQITWNDAHAMLVFNDSESYSFKQKYQLVSHDNDSPAYFTPTGFDVTGQEPARYHIILEGRPLSPYREYLVEGNKLELLTQGFIDISSDGGKLDVWDMGPVDVTTDNSSTYRWTDETNWSDINNWDDK